MSLMTVFQKMRFTRNEQRVKIDERRDQLLARIAKLRELAASRGMTHILEDLSLLDVNAQNAEQGWQLDLFNQLVNSAEVITSQIF